MFPVTDPILVFTLLALCMLVAPVFAERLRIPDLVLLLGFGALLGPHGLYVLDRSSAVTMLGSVGLLYIMFLAGLEIDLYRFRRSYKRSLLFGLLTFLIPQTLGTLAGRYVLGMSWPTSILLASMFASHTLLAYPLASRLGISRTEPVAITVGATIITDTLALLVLAVIADSARGSTLGPGFWATISIGLLILSLLIWRGVPWASRWFFQRVTEQSNAQFLFVLVLVCGFSYLSHFARMEPIIGAFLAGAAFNRLIPENSPLMHRVTFAGNTLFIPFFLLSVGMLVDPRAMLTGGRSWAVGGTMVVMVILTKYLAARIVRWRFRYSVAEGRVMFGLSVVQAAATLAAVIVGYDLGLFDDAVLNGAIFMILVTCPLGSWVVDRYGRRMALEAPVPTSRPGLQQRILVPVAHPRHAARLLDLAFLLRDPSRPGGIYPLAIARDDEHADEAVAHAENLLGHCLAHAASADTGVEPSLRMAVNVPDMIVHVSRELRAGTALIGWSGKQSASVRIFGTVMHHLVQKDPSRLYFCRLTGPLNTTRRLLVLFPPMASRRRDLVALVEDIKRLGHRAGAEVRIFTSESREAASLCELVQKTKPACPVHSINTASWAEARERLFAEIGEQDMIVLPLDRRNGILWTPELDRMPELVSTRFPNNSLLAVYPSLPSLDPSRSGPVADERSGRSFPELFPADLHHENPLDQALQRLAETAFPNRPEEASAACRALQNSLQSFPVELAPGTVLLHARCGQPIHPFLMVGFSPEGCEGFSLPEPPRVILALLGSDAAPPEEHLKTLSSVARRLHAIATDPAFSNATSAAELCRALAPPDPG